MNSFGLIAIGLLGGLLLSALAVGALILAYLTWQTRRDLLSQRSQLQRSLQHSAQVTAALQTSVTSSLSSLDADRLHEASQAIQLGSRRLAAAVTTLSKLLYSPQQTVEEPQPLYPGMDQPLSGNPVPSDHPDFTPGLDPAAYAALTGLSEDEIELQQARGITSMDQIAMDQARQAGREQLKAERRRQRAEREQQLQHQVSEALNPLQADVLAETRQRLVAAGIDPSQAFPGAALTEAAVPPARGGLPDLPDYHEGTPV